MNKIITIIIAILFFLITVGILIHVQSSFEEAKEILERCQSKGWDGVEFDHKFSNRLICSNFSQAEKDAKEDSQ